MLRSQIISIPPNRGTRRDPVREMVGFPPEGKFGFTFIRGTCSASCSMASWLAGNLVEGSDSLGFSSCL